MELRTMQAIDVGWQSMSLGTLVRLANALDVSPRGSPPQRRDAGDQARSAAQAPRRHLRGVLPVSAP
ncbi:hypothetical protein WME88_06150 [Sorangium sp. So ce216]